MKGFQTLFPLFLLPRRWFLVLNRYQEPTARRLDFFVFLPKMWSAKCGSIRDLRLTSEVARGARDPRCGWRPSAVHHMRRVSRRFGSHCPVQAPGLAALVVLVCVDLPAVSPFRVHGLGAGLPWARRAPKASGATALQCREPKGYAVVTAEGDGKAANLVIGNREGRRKWARTSGLTTTAAAILGTTQAANGKASDREDLELPVLLTYDQKLRNLLCDLKVAPSGDAGSHARRPACGSRAPRRALTHRLTHAAGPARENQG